mmetsp:Transcript_17517/g.41581  ORF Transcript_17517/g.41581 Transcript_17517/m.41581 type:complete len:109 (+) Transcript_17517:152-478(+)
MKSNNVFNAALGACGCSSATNFVSDRYWPLDVLLDRERAPTHTPTGEIPVNEAADAEATAELPTSLAAPRTPSPRDQRARSCFLISPCEEHTAAARESHSLLGFQYWP